MIRLEDAENSTTPSVATTPAQVSMASAQNLGQSNPIEYTPPTPEPPSIMERLERGFMRTVESTPQIVGQGLYYLGSHFDPSATPEQVKTGDSFGDRMAQMGLTMTDRNKQAIAEKFPEKPNWIENLGGAGPMIAAIGLGTLTGFGGATAASLAIGTGAALNNSAFESLRENSTLSTDDAGRLAAAVGITGGGAMALNVGNFLKAVGGPVKRFAKGIINGFVGGTIQTAITGAMQLYSGVTPYKGMDSLKDLLSDAVSTGVTFAIWGGPLGVHQALIQHAAVQKGIEDMGFSKATARKMASKVMAQGMEVGLKKAEAIVNRTKDEARRIQLKKLLANKPIDETGAPRLDALDEPFVPTEPSKAEALTADLEAKKRELELLKRDLAELKTAFVTNKEDLTDAEVKTDEKARGNYDRLLKVKDALESEIERIKDKLAPKKISPTVDLAQQIARIKQGFRAGVSATLKDAEFVQKEFNRLIDQSDLDLNDKAKFRKNVPLTVENFEKELPNILNKMQQLEQRAEQREWIKDIKKINLDKLPIDVRDALEPILKSFDFGFPTRSKIMERASTRAYFEQVLGNMEPDMITYEKVNGVDRPVYNLTAGERQALEDASKLSIPELLREPNGHERLRNIVNQIMTIYHEGVMKGKYYSNLKQRDHEAWVENYLKTIATSDRLSTFERSLKLKNQTIWQKIWNFKNAVFTAEMHSDMLFTLIHADEEHQALHEAYQNRIETQRLYSEKLSSIHARTDVGEAYKEQHDIDIKIGKETRTFKGVTGSQLLKAYAQSFEEKSLAHIENTFIRPGDSQDTGRTIMSELLKKTAELYPEQTKAILKQFDYFRGEGFDELDKVVVDMTGHHMTKVDFYDPLIGLEDRSGRDIENDMKLGVKGMQGRAEVGSGFTKTRVKSELAIKDLDYYGDLMKNSIARSNYVAMAKVMRDLNKKFYDPRVTTAIRDKYGAEALNTLHGLLRELAAGGSNHYGVIDKAMSYLRTSFIISKIGLNPWSAAKVSAQLSPAADYIGGLWVQKAVPDYLMNRDKYDKHINENSLMMKNMYLRQERDMEQLISSEGGSDLGPVKVRDEVAKLSMWAHLQMDMMVRRATWLAQENKMMAESPEATRDEINAACDAAVRWTHPMGGTLYLPAAFRGNVFQKMITTFHSATNRNFNLLMKANIDLGEKNITPLKWASKQLSIGLIPALIVSALSLHRKPTAREAALEYLNQTTGSEIYLGWVTSSLMSGREASMTNPYADIVNNASETITGKQLETKVKHGLSMVDDLAKTPLSNAFRDVMMVVDLAQGKSIAEPPRGLGRSMDRR